MALKLLPPTHPECSLAGRIEYAQLLLDGSEVGFSTSSARPQQIAYLDPGKPCGDTALLKLPVRRPDVVVPVVQLFLR